MAEGDQQTSEELALVLKELGLRMERLKQLYEQYFMGIERLEPLVARKEVTRAMIMQQQTYIRNTALRFKFNTMLQKWNIYLTYWTRTLREIENGTYIRHIQKAQRAAEKKGNALPAEMKKLHGAKHTDDELPEATIPNAPPVIPQAPVLQPPPGMRAAPPPLPGALPKAPPLPGAAVKAPPPLPGAAVKAPPPLPPGIARPPVDNRPTQVMAPVDNRPTQAMPPVPRPPVAQQVVPGMSEPELRALHKKYSEARTAAGDAAPVRYESLVASLAKQVPKMLEQPGVRGVRFDVTVQDGKAVLKAIPRK